VWQDAQNESWFSNPSAPPMVRIANALNPMIAMMMNLRIAVCSEQ
jgi:hypothetical protein